MTRTLLILFALGIAGCVESGTTIHKDPTARITATAHGHVFNNVYGAHQFFVVRDEDSGKEFLAVIGRNGSAITEIGKSDLSGEKR